MLIRILFVVVALAAAAAFFSPHPVEFGGLERLQRNLLLVGGFVVSVGMIVPWGRWVEVSSPGPNLGFLSKLLGWCGAAFAPLALWSDRGLVGAACILVLVSSVALWKRRAWAAWPWYALALAAFAAAVRGVVGVLSGGPPLADGAYETGRSAGGWLGIVLWSAVGFVLVREITAWRRALAGPVRTDDSPRER